MRMLAVAIKAIKDTCLWDAYFNDFIGLKYRTDSNAFTGPISQIILAYFDFKKNCTDDTTSKLARVHIRSEVKQIDLAQTIDRVTKLLPLINPSTSSVTESIFSPKSDDLGSFVIENTYNSLKSILSKESVNKLYDNLMEWYKAYRDIVSN